MLPGEFAQAIRHAVENHDGPGPYGSKGISEGALRARVLNGTVLPHVYVSNEHAEGTQKTFLPEWTRERFPLVRWTDHGSWAGENPLADDYSWTGRNPKYTLSGWVMLDAAEAGVLLVRS